METRLNVLMVEDRPDDAELNTLYLKKAGYHVEVRRVDTEGDFLDALNVPPDLILVDWSLPQFSGQRALQLLAQKEFDIPLILVSGSIGEEQAVAAMQKGAYDYVLKDRPGRLGQAVAHALEQKQMREEQRRVEIALLESEEKFRTLFHHVSSGILMVENRSLAIHLANGAACRMLGYAEQDLLGKPLNLILTANSLDELVRRFDTSNIEQVEAGPIQTKFRTASGCQIPIEVHTSAVEIHSKVYELVEFTDITQRQMAEEIIRSNAERLRAIFAISQSIEVHTEQEILEAGLEIAVRVTGSKAGFFLFLSEDLTEISRTIWSEAVRVSQKTASLQKIPPDSSLASCIRQGDLIVVNDNSIVPGGFNFSGDLFEVFRHIVMPVKTDRKVRALIGIANKPDAYSENDELQLRLIADDIWIIVERRRSEKAREFDLHWQQLVSQIGRIFNTVVSGEYQKVFEEAIQRLCEFWMVELGAILKVVDKGHFQVVSSWSKDSFTELMTEASIERIPSAVRFMIPEDGLVILGVDDLPEGASAESKILRIFGLQSILVLPLMAAGKLIGVVTIYSSKAVTEWYPDMPNRMKLVGDLFVHAINRMDADELLRRSEERFRRLADNASDVIFRINLVSMKFEYVSPVVLRITGYSPEEMYSDIDLIERLIHPEDHSLIAVLQQNVLPNGSPIVMRWIRKDGRMIWVELRHSLIYDDQGRVCAFEGIARDITTRKDDEAKLRKSKEENELLVMAGRKLSSTLDPTVIYSSLYEMASQVMDCSWLIVSNYESQTKLLRCVFAANDRIILDVSQCQPVLLEQPEESIRSRVIHSGKPLILHNRDKEPGYPEILGFDEPEAASDFSIRPHSMLLVPILLEGQVVGIVQVSSSQSNSYSQENLRMLEALTLQMAAAMHNAALYQRAQNEVAERRKAEESLRQANLVVERSPAILFRWREEPGWPVILVSENITQFGYKPEDFLLGGMVYADIMLPDEVQSITAKYDAFPATGDRHSQQEYRLKTRDGQIRWVEERTMLVRDEAGNILYSEGIVIDTTDKKVAELALKENAFRFQAIFNHHYQLTALMDPDGILLAVNSSALKFAGVEEKDLLGKPFWEGPWWAHSHELQEKLILSIRDASRGNFIRYETTHLDGNGSLHDIDFSLNPILDEEGIVIYIVPEGRDITEYRMAVAEAEHLNERLAKLYELGLALAQTLELSRVYQIAYEHVSRLVDAPYFGISFFDPENYELQIEYPVLHGVLRPKSEFPRIVFRRDKAPVGRLKAIRSAQPQIIFGLREKAIAAVRSGEAMIISDEGDEMIPDTALYVPMIFGGSVIGLMEVQSYSSHAYTQEHAAMLGSIANQVALAIERARLFDQARLEVEERRRAEAALRDSEERLRMAITAGNHGLYDWDIQNNQLETNAEYLSMLGYDPETTATEQNWWASHLHPDDREATIGALMRYLNGDLSEYHVEFRLRASDGQWVWIDSAGQIVAWDVNGKPTRLLGTHTDITARKLYEEQMRASLVEKEVLLREIHHRVKNNLEVIISLAELQSRGISDPVSKGNLLEFQERVRTIALVHENLYRSEDMANINAHGYFNKLASNLFQAFGPPGVEVEVDAQDVTIAIETAIPCGLIVTELVTNAFKHAFPISSPRKYGKVNVKLERQEPNLVLTVQDNGPGLPDELNWQTTRSLGLRLVNRLAGQLHGTLEVMSDAGTCFRLTFPNPLKSD